MSCYHAMRQYGMNVINQPSAVKSGVFSHNFDSSHTRLPRIATVCVLGDRAKRSTINSRRYRLMKQVIDAVIFPGGHFLSKSYVGHHSYSKRKLLIEYSKRKLLIENGRPGEVCRWTASQGDLACKDM